MGPPCLLHDGFKISFKVVKLHRLAVMTCSTVIFWERGCCGVYSIYSTVWLVQGLNCSRNKKFFLLQDNQTGSGVPGYFTWIKLGRV
jgi:hypothetical protein